MNSNWALAWRFFLRALVLDTNGDVIDSIRAGKCKKILMHGVPEKYDISYSHIHTRIMFV